MGRPESKPAASVDHNPAGITEEAAIEGLRREYGLSLGAAIRQLQDAWNSGNIVDAWDNLAEVHDDGTMVLHDGKPVHLPPRLSQITGGFVHDLRMNADDLRWQIEQQLGKLAVPVPQRRYQRCTDASELADKGGRPPEVRDAVTEWFKELPDDQRTLGANKLAESYCAGTPRPPGSYDRVRKIIPQLKKRSKEGYNPG